MTEGNKETAPPRRGGLSPKVKPFGYAALFFAVVSVVFVALVSLEKLLA
jgi:hypothetical protein